MLKRETRLPLRDARRPCVLVGAVLAVLFLAASVDAVLWQQSVERQYLEERAAAAEARAAAAEERAAAAAAEIERLTREVTELDRLRLAAELECSDEAESVEELSSEGSINNTWDRIDVGDLPATIPDRR